RDWVVRQVTEGELSALITNFENGPQILHLTGQRGFHDQLAHARNRLRQQPDVVGYFRRRLAIGLFVGGGHRMRRAGRYDRVWQRHRHVARWPRSPGLVGGWRWVRRCWLGWFCLNRRQRLPLDL